MKWGKESIELKIIAENGVKGLKTELEEKTGVPFDRMKLMPKSKGLWKGVLKDEFDLKSIDFSKAKKPVQILLMGSAAKLAGPKVKTVFMEDLPPEEAAKVAPEPSGLVNLGNTCYLNSVVQCLRSVPSFRMGLRNYSATGRNPANSVLLTSLRDLYGSLDRTADAVPPSGFVMTTKMAFPQFAQRGPQGQPMQQDAEEFFSGLLTVAATEMTGKATIQTAFDADAATSTITDDELNGASNLIDAVFGLKMEETLNCDEFASAPSSTSMDVDESNSSLQEPPVKSYDLHRKLVCNIQGGSDSSSQVNVNHIAEGISLSLNGKIEKRSEALGRDAIWTRTQRIARLPPIIVVQFGRFYWKATPDSQDHAGVKCKVMKPVAFTSVLDVYEFCSNDVQKVLKVSRDKAAAEEEDRIAKKLKADSTSTEEQKQSTDTSAKPESMDVDPSSSDCATESEAKQKPLEEDEEEDEGLQEALAMSVEPDLKPVGPGLPNDFQGIYELFGVVTHKGRDADGGHYMGWVKDDSSSGRTESAKIADTDEENENWFVFDDDEVSPCKTEDVLKLKGGGDWHMSYLNFYRAKK